MKDVYYDFDKFNIRGDASFDLDRVVHLLKTYPSMHISLESHTDSRGSNRYNNRLSKNRAKEARAYIISKGIDARRMSFKGFGENNLINHCGNEVPCEEPDHQRNRRTEIRVTKFDQNINIQYGN